MSGGFNRSTLTPTARLLVRRVDDEDAEWRQKIREQRDKMMLPPVVPQPEPPVELLACVLYNSPVWIEAREAAEVAPESKPPRQRGAKGESANDRD